MSTQENAPTNTTEVILKFLAPSDTNWQELKPSVPTEATEVEKRNLKPKELMHKIHLRKHYLCLCKCRT